MNGGRETAGEGFEGLGERRRSLLRRGIAILSATAGRRLRIAGEAHLRSLRRRLMTKKMAKSWTRSTRATTQTNVASVKPVSTGAAATTGSILTWMWMGSLRLVQIEKAKKQRAIVMEDEGMIEGSKWKREKLWRGAFMAC
ncbi:hypothetical protein B0H12DRAFT_1100500 [Mycena haematopus]|nr:hypothetical protein B0H12DRAFT_1100500 [Mycena haematopus]